MKEKGRAAARVLFAEYKNNARRRGYYFGLTLDQFIGITSQECNYCGAPPAKELFREKLNGSYFYNGVDRVDNSEGYYLENVVPCCEVCNRAKNDMPLDDFLMWIERLVEFNA